MNSGNLMCLRFNLSGKLIESTELGYERCHGVFPQPRISSVLISVSFVKIPQNAGDGSQ